MTAAGHKSMTKTGAKKFALSRVGSCTAVAYLVHPPASMADRTPIGRIVPHADASAATRTQSSASLAFC